MMFQNDPPPTFYTKFIKYTVFFLWSHPLVLFDSLVRIIYYGPWSIVKSHRYSCSFIVFGYEPPTSSAHNTLSPIPYLCGIKWMNQPLIKLNKVYCEKNGKEQKILGTIENSVKEVQNIIS